MECKKRENRALWIALVLYLLLILLLYLLEPKEQKQDTRYFPFNDRFANDPGAVVPQDIQGGKENTRNKNGYVREFRWNGGDKKEHRVSFSIPRDHIRREWREFGVPRELQKPAILRQKGFQLIGNNIYIVDYGSIFKRNREYFPILTRDLYQAAGVKKTDDHLPEYLRFTQAVEYRKPPSYYRNKFINAFFPPLVCIYEQYGDCDSKSLLLAVFLSHTHNKEKLAVVLIRAMGLNHAFLAVQRNPLPGMSSIFIMGKGYYIPLETSAPGWAPGFVSERVWDVVRARQFLFMEL